MDAFTPESLALCTECLVCVVLVWGCVWVATTPRQHVPVCALVVVLWFLLSEGSESALAQTTPVTGALSNTTPGFPSVVRNGVQLPDWSKISFSSMDPFSESGSVTIPPEVSGALGFDKVEWKAGQKLADALPLGAIQGCLGFEALTQKNIDSITGQVSSGVGLDQFLPAGLQSIKSLNDAVPGLAGQLVGNVKPVSDLVAAGLAGKLPGFDPSTLQGLVSSLSGGFSGVQQIIDTARNPVGTLVNGQFLDQAGNVLGQINSAGQVLDTTGNVLGSLNQAGQFVNPAGQVVGALSNPAGAASQAVGGAVSAYVGSSGLNPQALTIGQLTQQFPQLAALGLKNLDLSRYTMSQIPELDNTPIGHFANWEQVLMKGVPGFDQIPFNKFPSPLQEGVDAYVARVDVPLDQEEQDREKSLSGSYKQGFRVPCTQNCEHAELSPIQGSQMDATNLGSFANGKSWMSKKQLVEGGEGVLAAVNGGKEPTGRNPYCSMFKQVITKVDQPGGKVGTSMYFRVCKHGIPDLGCTPYIIGPIPFLTYAEKQFIYLGEGNPKDDGGGIGLPGSDDPLSATDGFDDCGGTKLSGDYVNKAIATVDKVAAALSHGDPAFATSSANGAKVIPGVLAALKDEGITNPNEVSYVLATVNRETSFVNFEEGPGTRYQSSDGTPYWGRGYVQLTHRESYQAATNYLRSKGINVDLVANPDLAMRPDIAARILAYGMKTGALYGDGMTLSKCAGGARVDWVACRRIVNDGAQATEIAQAAKMYRDAIADSNLADTTTSSSTCGASSQGSPDGWFDPLPGAIETHVFGEFPHGSHTHAGSDIAPPSGNPPVHAARDGVVVEAMTGCVEGDHACGGGYGNYVIIAHPNGYVTLYGHNTRPLVKAGDHVKGGQPIAIVGNTGHSFGTHSHFEMERGSSFTYGMSAAVSPASAGVPHAFSNRCARNVGGGRVRCE